MWASVNDSKKLISGDNSQNHSGAFSKDRTGAHKIEDLGAGFVVPLWDHTAVDDISTVSTEEVMEVCRPLATKEGIFAGTSTGGNIVDAIRNGMELGPGKTVATLMCDSGAKYLSAVVYKESSKTLRSGMAHPGTALVPTGNNRNIRFYKSC